MRVFKMTAGRYAARISTATIEVIRCRADDEDSLPAGWHIVWPDGETTVYPTLQEGLQAVRDYETKGLT